jgi:hypothetical protein
VGDPDEGYNQESRRQLRNYLAEAMRRRPAVQLALYDCWEGDEQLPVERRGAATPEEIASTYDPVPERTFVDIVSNEVRSGGEP